MWVRGSEAPLFSSASKNNKRHVVHDVVSRSRVKVTQTAIVMMHISRPIHRA